MKSIPRSPLAAALFALTLAPLAPTVSGAATADAYWPQWRGPRATGVAPQANPPTEWSETNHVRWKVKLPGRGKSTPIIWENQVFLQTAIPTGKKTNAPAAAPETTNAPAGPGRMRAEKPTAAYQFALLCLDRKNGQTLWQQVAREEVPHEGHHQADGSFASGSPVTDGQSVFAFFGSRGLHRYDRQGRLLWSKDLGRMQTRNAFGEGSSPALFENTLVITWDHEGDDFIAAFDKETGRELWRQPRQEDTSWATPLILSHAGQTQVIASATSKIISYDLATGRQLWECTGMTANVIPTPVADDTRLYAISGFRGSALLAIRLGRSGTLTGTDAIAWQYAKSTPYVPSPLLAGDRLYFFAGNNPVLSCFDAPSGRPLIDAARLDGLQGVYASPVAAAGRVYLVGRNGATVVLKQADTLDLLATNRLDDRIDASPALVGNELFLRGTEYLYCLAEN